MQAGGPQYATLGALAYRQVLAGTKLVWNDRLNTMWYFMKEISSDGDVSTVDVVFPSYPIPTYLCNHSDPHFSLPILQNFWGYS